MAQDKTAMSLLKAHLSEVKALGDKEWRAIVSSLEAPQERGRTAGLIALCDDDALHRRWWQLRKDVPLDALDRAEHLILVTIEEDAIEARIDQALAAPAPAPMVEALARAGVSWASPALEKMLDDAALRMPAALVLVGGELSSIASWLDGVDDPFEAVEFFRAAALAGAEHLWDEAEDWLEALEEAEEVRAARYLRGAMATLDPRAYARKLVLGEVELDWLGNSTCVADFLQVHGPTDWVETLALLEEGGARDAFEFAALIAVAASFDDDVASDDEAAVAAVVDLAEHLEDPYGAAQAFAFQIALGEEDDLIGLLAEASLHERARRLEVASSGLSGLVLSGTDLELLPKIEKIELFFTQMGRRAELSAEDVVVLVRTLSDLGAWYAREPEHFKDLVLRVVKRYRKHDCRPVCLAAQRLEALVEEKTPATAALVERAANEKMTGFDAVRRLVEGDEEAGLGSLVELWTGGPCSRAMLYREAIVTLFS